MRDKAEKGKNMKIICVDFDNTLSLHGNFPDVGEPNIKLFEYLIKRQSEGDCIILWTCRCGKALEAAVDFCRNNGLIFNYVNENHPDKIAEYVNDCRKIFAHVYIDDCAKTPWEVIDYKPKEKPVMPRRRAVIIR